MSNADAIIRTYDALAVGNIGPLGAIFADHIVWNSAEGNPLSTGAALVGGEDIFGKLFSKIDTHWNDFLCRPVSVHTAGNVVVVEARYTAVGKKTGLPLDAQACHVWEFGEDGLVTRFQQYTDTAQWQLVLDAQGNEKF